MQKTYKFSKDEVIDLFEWYHFMKLSGVFLARRVGQFMEKRKIDLKKNHIKPDYEKMEFTVSPVKQEKDGKDRV